MKPRICAAAFLLIVAGACTGTSSGSVTTTTAASTTAASTVAASTTAAGSTSGGSGFLEPDTVHTISVTIPDADLSKMIDTYVSTRTKEWVEATVTIDGKTYERVGVRLKGNSSLRSLNVAAASAEPQTLPLLIRLDKFVDDQEHQGVDDLIVRSNSSQTAMNEAVALDLLSDAGLTSQAAALAKFTVNGSAADLRLVLEDLDTSWQKDNFTKDGLLYKAEPEGDYTYRGADPAAYDEIFEQETGDDNLVPLIEFLDFVNNSDDAKFEAELATRLDVASFAKYLAFEELVDNFDDIDGPGNNSYLYWDSATNKFTVVAWDHNLAFGLRPGIGGPGGPGGPGVGGPGVGGPDGPRGPRIGGAPPQDFPAGFPAGVPGGGPGGFPGGGPGGGPMGRNNPLVTRFMGIATFSDMVTAAKAELKAKLFTDGAAAESLAQWSALISEQASDVVDAATVQADAAGISKYLV